MTGWRLMVWMFTSVCPAAVPWREMGHRHTCLKVGCRNTTSRWVLHRGLAMQTILTLQGQNRVAMIMETKQQNSIKPIYCISSSHFLQVLLQCFHIIQSLAVYLNHLLFKNKNKQLPVQKYWTNNSSLHLRATVLKSWVKIEQRTLIHCKYNLFITSVVMQTK